MDSDRLNRRLTLGANVAVLLGIGLLILELQQNRAAVRAETRSNISQDISNQLLQIALDPDLSELRKRADSGGPVTDLEAYRYSLMQRSLLRYWENVYYQFKVGLYDESEYSAHKKVWGEYVDYSEALRVSWCNARNSVSEDFAREFESAAENFSCSELE